MTQRIYVGMDLSLAHGALVAVADWSTDNDPIYSAAFCEKVKDQHPAEHVSRIPADVLGERDWSKKNADRFFWYTNWLNQGVSLLVDVAEQNDAELHFVLEDYAYAADRGAHQIGEVGGFARLRIELLRRRKIRARLRLHDPGSVKIFAAGRGDADKDDVRLGVIGTYGVTFDQYKPKPVRSKKVLKNPETSVVREDIFDAYVLSQMGRLEDEIRRGLVRTQDCSERQIKVFNRVTKRYPTNLLDRPYAVGGPS